MARSDSTDTKAVSNVADQLAEFIREAIQDAFAANNVFLAHQQLSVALINRGFTLIQSVLQPYPERAL